MYQIESILRSQEAAGSLALPASLACPGVEGSYSHKACETAFSQPKIRYYPHFEDVFEAVTQGCCRYGVVPIENTLAGSVTDTYDLLLHYRLSIIASVKLKIEHCLLGVNGASLEGLREVSSHSQALHQCSDFFRKHQQIQAHEFSNTAAAAKQVATLANPQHAAIASFDCAKRYGLQLLCKNLQNRKDNFTRFVVLSKEPICRPESSRISLMIRVAHEAGALYRVLSRFADAQINLLKLESRPIPESPFEVLFYWDFAGNLADPSVQNVIKLLDQDTVFVQNLGNYPEL